MMNKTQNQVRLISFPKITDPRGNLSFAEGGTNLPFEIQRVYWTFDIPGGGERDGRALMTCAEVLIVTSGSADIIVDRGDGVQQTFTLNRSNTGLYLPPMTWRRICNIATASTCVTLSSKLFDENDYIRDYHQFLEVSHGQFI